MPSSADMSSKVKLYEHFRDVASGNTPDPTMLEAREVAEQYIKCHIRGHMKCIDKNFDEFLNGQFAPSQITLEMEQKLKDVVFNSDMVETTHGLLKYQDKLSMGNSKPGQRRNVAINHPS